MFKAKLMNRVELIIPERDVVPVTEALAASGVFHIVKNQFASIENTTCPTNEWQNWAVRYANLERRILVVMEALGVDEGPPPEKTPHLVGPDVAQRDVEHLEEEAQAPVQELKDEQHRLGELQQYISRLIPISDLDIQLDVLRKTRYALVIVGTMPITNMERLRTSVDPIPFVLVELHRTEHLASVVLFGLQRDSEILNRAARSAYLNPLTPPETYRGTPLETIQALKAGIERTSRHAAEIEAEIERLRGMRIEHLRHLLWRVRASRTLADTIAHYGHLRYTYVVEGWVPAALVLRLQDTIAQVSDHVLIEVQSPRRQDAGDIPVALDNPRFLNAFQGLVTNYGLPSYDELDPTPIIALTFPLVFGIMFGDVGQGLLVALFGFLLTPKRLPALKSLAGLGPIMIASGLAATVFGALYGSIFGFEDVFAPLWIRPVESVTDILLATIGIGIGMLCLGMLSHIVNTAFARRWGSMIFSSNGITGLIFYLAMLGIVATTMGHFLPIGSSIFILLALVSGTAVALSELLARWIDGERPLVEGGVGTYIVQAAFELFETLLSMLSNTLSYVRMGAFAVAHGALSIVVFILADMVGSTHSLGYWLVVIAGNL
ncbi:MAG: hypothetical protein MUQ10_11290, partial [Anaerolineae bacterium]|nr:hypothetical protein [Anaerolineae bacterium]